MNSTRAPEFPERIRFWKYSASANDFIVLNNRDDRWSEIAPELARLMCARRYSVGADGLILIGQSDSADVRVRYFNPDGKEFQTCGNGGRCAARFASHHVLHQPRLTLQTNSGTISAEVRGESVRISFIPPGEIKLGLNVSIEGRFYRGHVVKLGDPHFVIPSGRVDEMNFVSIARTIRHHPVFLPEGTNVHFIEIRSPQKVRIRSFERGVEDETLACGSGCISAAVAMFSCGLVDPPVTLLPESGIPLTVHFGRESYSQDLALEGDARMIYEGELSTEALNGFPLPAVME